MSLVVPKRVLLDTWVLQQVLRIRQGKPADSGHEKQTDGFRQINSAIEKGLIRPVYCEATSYEWALVDSESHALSVARIFDAAPPALCVIPDSCIFVVEILDAAKDADPSLPIDKIEIVAPIELRDSRYASLAKIWPELKQGETRYLSRTSLSPSVETMVRMLRASPISKQGLLGKALVGWREAAQKTVKDFKGAPRSRFTDGSIREWMNRGSYAGEILTRLTNENRASELIKTVPIESCPSVRLWLETLNQYYRAKGSFEAINDVTDFVFPALVPYVDIALIERRMGHFMRQAIRHHTDIRTPILTRPDELAAMLRDM